MVKSIDDVGHVLGVGLEATFVTPALDEPSVDIAEYLDEVVVELYPVSVNLSQLVNANLTNVRPYTKNVGEVFNLGE
jgi:hypothetical protein